MERVHEAAGQSYADPEEQAPFSLSEYLSESVLTGSCFCCGAFTELLVDESGQAFLVCPSCGAEVSDADTSRAGRISLALQAA